MPVITIEIDRFSKIMGRKVTIEELVEKIPSIGVDIEEIGEDYLRIEYNPNRPDLGTLVGIVRAYKGITREEIGLPRYELKGKEEYKILVDNSVKEVRPFIAGFVAENVPMDEQLLTEMIAYQEDLHTGIGRKRRKVAIGIHNLDIISFPLKYFATKDANFKFIPLNETREMKISEILTTLETGRQYGDIVTIAGAYPIISEASGNVISFPPIINAELTRVTPNTKNLLIEITGTDYKSVMNTANLLATYLYDCRAEIWEVKVIYDEKEQVSPDLSLKEIRVKKNLIRQLLGLNLTDETIISCIRACRLEAISDKDEIVVKIPPYRIDIMHPVDIVEEVAIGYGYENMEPELPEVLQVGKSNEKRDFENLIAGILTGMEMQEVITYTLSSLETQFRKMNLKGTDFIRVMKSKTGELEILRVWIIPNLLQSLRISQKERYPQRIFEIGKVIFRRENKVVEENHLAILVSHSKAGYSDVKAILDTLLEMLELKGVVKKADHSSFIPGRYGHIFVEDMYVGMIGEVHPAVLEAFALENPVAAIEINLDKLYLAYKHRHLNVF